jgi:hypothetical protein
MSPLQTVEDNAFALYTERWPDVAVGAQLDNLGEIVGQPREGRTDDVYRLWLQARILVNRSTGKADDTLTLLALIAGDSDFDLIEYPPAAYAVYAFDLGVDEQAVFDLVKLVKPAGVRMILVYSESPAEDLFRYDTPGKGYDGSAVYAGSVG